MRIYMDVCCLNRPFDDLHLACAEKSAEVMLTTDDEIVEIIKKFGVGSMTN